MSLLPNEDVSFDDIGASSCSMTCLEDDDVSRNGGGAFELDNYGSTLQPAMTPELEAKINRSVSDAFNQIKN
jgi:hypothetical protein